MYVCMCCLCVAFVHSVRKVLHGFIRAGRRAASVCMCVCIHSWLVRDRNTRNLVSGSPILTYTYTCKHTHYTTLHYATLRYTAHTHTKNKIFGFRLTSEKQALDES